MTLPVSTPSEQGLDPRGVLAFVDAAEQIVDAELHGLIIQRHGQRVVEGYWAPYTPERERLVYSLSKTFTSTALGLQVGEGRLGLDDLVADHLPDLLLGADPMTRRMRIRHIASMASGHDHDMLGEAVTADPADPLRGFFTIPPSHEPGTIFAYNQPAVIALAVILQRLAGQSLVDYLRPRLCDPIGFGPLSWQQYRPGFDLGFSGAHARLDAVARLGQLYLDDGRWDGRAVLPPGWVSQASHNWIATPGEPEPDWRRGYGFLLWQARHGYRGDGAYGQFMIVLPDQDAVIAVFAGTERMQAVLDAVWTHLLPAFTDTADAAGRFDHLLVERMRSLALPTAVERTRGSTAPAVHQKLHAAAGPDRSLMVTSIEMAGDHLVLHEDGRSLRVPLHPGWTPAEPDYVAASAALDPAGRIAVDLVFLDTPHRLAITADLESSTFTTRWDTAPLRLPRAGIRLTDLHRPTYVERSG